MSNDETCPVREEELEREEKYYEGLIVENVPELPAGKFCNVRETDEEDCFVGYCDQYASYDTETEERGRCKPHSVAKPPYTALQNNQRASKHHMNSDPLKYAQNLDTEDEEEYIEGLKEVILDRLRETKEPDFLDDVMAKRVATKFHIVEQASEYVQAEGLVQVVYTEHGQHEDKNPVLQELRLYDSSIMTDLKRLGLLNDPETQKADALAEWRDYIE